MSAGPAPSTVGGAWLAAAAGCRCQRLPMHARRDLPQQPPSCRPACLPSPADRRHPQPWRHYNITLLAYEKDLVTLNDQKKDDVHGLFPAGTNHSLLTFWPHTVLPGTYARHYRAQEEAQQEATSGTASGAGAAAGDGRPYDICVVGQLHSFHYPIRSKLAQWMEEGLFERHGLRSKMLPHFGYTEQVGLARAACTAPPPPPATAASVVAPPVAAQA